MSFLAGTPPPPPAINQKVPASGGYKNCVAMYGGLSSLLYSTDLNIGQFAELIFFCKLLYANCNLTTAIWKLLSFLLLYM